MKVPFARQLRPLLAFENRWQLLINRIVFNKTGPTVYLYKGHPFLADHNAGDQDGIRACLSPGLYDPFFEVWKPSGPISFLDAGANSGGFPFALLKHDIPVSKGICVELNPTTFRRLNYNVGSLFSGAIAPLNLALAGKDYEGTVHLGGGGVTDSIFKSCGSDSLPAVSVRFVTLDSLMNEYFPAGVDVLKMDIEGAEYEALELAASETLGRCRNLLIEIHGEPEIQGKLIERLEARGFQRKITHRSFIEPNVFWFNLEEQG